MGSDHPPHAPPPRASDARADRSRHSRHTAGMKPWARCLCLAAGIALLALVLREVDLGAVASAAAAFGVTAMLAVLALYAVEFLADTAGWHLAVTSVPFDAGWLRRLFVTRLVGEAVNTVTPLAGMGGEPVKAWLLKRRHAIEYGESAASLVIARTVNLLALIPFAGIGLMLAASDPRLPGAYGASAGIGLAVLAAATLAFFTVQRFRIASSLGRLGGRRPDGVIGRRGATALPWNEPARAGPAARRRGPPTPLPRNEPAPSSPAAPVRARPRRRSPLVWIEAFDDRLLHFYTRHRRRFALALALAFLNWCVGALGVFVTMRFLGVEISVADAWILESFTQLVRAGTFFIPASIGAQEGVYVLVAGALTGNAAAGFAAALIRRCRGLLWTAAGLAVGWRHARAPVAPSA